MSRLYLSRLNRVLRSTLHAVDVTLIGYYTNEVVAE